MTRICMGVLCLSLLFVDAASARPSAPGFDALLVEFRGRLRSLASCYGLDPRGSHKGNLSVEVQPAGDVSDVQLDGTLAPVVRTCIGARARAWKFGAFAGEARRLTSAVLVVAGQ